MKTKGFREKGKNFLSAERGGQEIGKRKKKHDAFEKTSARFPKQTVMFPNQTFRVSPAGAGLTAEDFPEFFFFPNDEIKKERLFV